MLIFLIYTAAQFYRRNYPDRSTSFRDEYENGVQKEDISNFI